MRRPTSLSKAATAQDSIKQTPRQIVIALQVSRQRLSPSVRSSPLVHDEYGCNYRSSFHNLPAQYLPIWTNLSSPSPLVESPRNMLDNLKGVRPYTKEAGNEDEDRNRIGSCPSFAPTVDENGTQVTTKSLQAEARHLVRKLSDPQVDLTHPESQIQADHSQTLGSNRQGGSLDLHTQSSNESDLSQTSTHHPAYKPTVLSTLLLASRAQKTENTAVDQHEENDQATAAHNHCTSDYKMVYRSNSCTQELSRNRSGFEYFDFAANKQSFDHVREVDFETDRSSEVTALPHHKQQRSGSGPSSRANTLEEGIASEIADILARRKYLLKLCSMMLEYGAPTHRIEQNLASSSRALAVDADFLYLPGAVICTFIDHTTYANNVEVVRKAAGVDCGRMQDVVVTVGHVIHRDITAHEGLVELEAIARRPHHDHILVHIMTYGLASMCIAPLAFDANLIDLIPIFFLGSYLGFLKSHIVVRSQHFSNVFEVFACISIAFIARALGSIPWPHSSSGSQSYIFCFSALAQSSIVLILPGIPVLNSALELQSRNIISGSVRMVHSIIFVLFISFGLLLGTTIFGLMLPSAVDDVTCVNPAWFAPSLTPDYKLIYTRFIWVPLFACCIARVFRAKWRQLPVMALVAVIGHQVQFWVATQLASNSHVANAVASFAIGCAGTLYARFSPSSGGLAAAAMLPAVCVQVPGGLASAGGLVAGVASSRQMLTNDTHVSVINNGTRGLIAAQNDPDSVYSGTIFNVGYSMVQIAIGISVGLYMSTLVMYPIVKKGKKGLFSF